MPFIIAYMPYTIKNFLCVFYFFILVNLLTVEILKVF